MYLGIDLGTGSLKCLLLDGDGHTFAESSATYGGDASARAPGEMAVEHWRRGLLDAVNRLPAQARQAVRAIGLSGQMHGVVLLDAAGQALRPALLWTDQRAAGLRANHPEAACGNPFAPGMAGPLLSWLAQHETQTLSRARWALQAKDWLGFLLTGIALSDPSDASATLLSDADGEWDQAGVHRWGIDPDCLAPLRGASEIRGLLRAELAAELGLPVGVPVAVGAGDTAAAIVGSGLAREGEAQLTTGTGAQLIVLRHAPPPASAVLNRYRSAYQAPLPAWYTMAAMQNAGVALEWARGILGLSWDRAYELAFAASLRETGVLFLPYLTGERTPWMNPAVRGGWVGLSPADDAVSLMRAAFRGVALGLRAGLTALIESGIPIELLKLAGGGSVHPAWRQLLADTLGRPLAVLQQANASARGAALLGGMATGHWRAMDIATLALPTEAVFEPRVADAEAATLEYHRFLALYERLADAP